MAGIIERQFDQSLSTSSDVSFNTTGTPLIHNNGVIYLTASAPTFDPIVYNHSIGLGDVGTGAGTSAPFFFELNPSGSSLNMIDGSYIYVDTSELHLEPPVTTPTITLGDPVAIVNNTSTSSAPLTLTSDASNNGIIFGSTSVDSDYIKFGTTTSSKLQIGSSTGTTIDKNGTIIVSIDDTTATDGITLRRVGTAGYIHLTGPTNTITATGPAGGMNIISPDLVTINGNSTVPGIRGVTIGDTPTSNDSISLFGVTGSDTGIEFGTLGSILFDVSDSTNLYITTPSDAIKLDSFSYLLYTANNVDQLSIGVGQSNTISMVTSTDEYYLLFGTSSLVAGPMLYVNNGVGSEEFLLTSKSGVPVDIGINGTGILQIRTVSTPVSGKAHISQSGTTGVLGFGTESTITSTAARLTLDHSTNLLSVLGFNFSDNIANVSTLAFPSSGTTQNFDMLSTTFQLRTTATVTTLTHTTEIDLIAPTISINGTDINDLIGSPDLNGELSIFQNDGTTPIVTFGATGGTTYFQSDGVSDFFTLSSTGVMSLYKTTGGLIFSHTDSEVTFSVPVRTSIVQGNTTTLTLANSGSTTIGTWASINSVNSGYLDLYSTGTEHGIFFGDPSRSLRTTSALSAWRHDVLAKVAVGGSDIMSFTNGMPVTNIFSTFIDTNQYGIMFGDTSQYIINDTSANTFDIIYNPAGPTISFSQGLLRTTIINSNAVLILHNSTESTLRYNTSRYLTLTGTNVDLQYDANNKLSLSSSTAILQTETNNRFAIFVSGGDDTTEMRSSTYAKVNVNSMDLMYWVNGTSIPTAATDIVVFGTSGNSPDFNGFRFFGSTSYGIFMSDGATGEAFYRHPEAHSFQIGTSDVLKMSDSGSTSTDSVLYVCDPTSASTLVNTGGYFSMILTLTENDGGTTQSVTQTNRLYINGGLTTITDPFSGYQHKFTINGAYQIDSRTSTRKIFGLIGVTEVLNTGNSTYFALSERGGPAYIASNALVFYISTGGNLYHTGTLFSGTGNDINPAFTGGHPIKPLTNYDKLIPGMAIKVDPYGSVENPDGSTNIKVSSAIPTCIVCDENYSTQLYGIYAWTDLKYETVSDPDSYSPDGIALEHQSISSVYQMMVNEPSAKSVIAAVGEGAALVLLQEGEELKVGDLLVSSMYGCMQLDTEDKFIQYAETQGITADIPLYNLKLLRLYDRVVKYRVITTSYQEIDKSQYPIPLPGNTKLVFVGIVFR